MSVKAREQSLRRQLRKWTQGNLTLHRSRRSKNGLVVGGVLAAYQIKDNGKNIAIFSSLKDADKRHKEVLRNAVNYSLYEQHCLTTDDLPKPFAEFLEEQAVRDRDLEATIQRLQTTLKVEDPEDAVLPTDSDVE